jgi:hypothetical protein
MSFLLIPIQTYPNTALGYESSINTTTGTSNTAFGQNSLRNNTAGSTNVAIGDGALYTNDSGDGNVAIGWSAMFANLTGDGNCAIGEIALQDNVSGIGNSAFGKESLRRNNGNYNSAFGGGAGYNITTGTLNTLVGFVSGYNITTGSKNTVLGPFNGNQFGLDIRTLSNYIVISDGDGNPRIWVNNLGQVNFPGGAVLPGGTANGVLYLNASGVVTSGTSLAFLPSITGASTNPILDIAGTWNTTGAANGIRLNVTDTASAAGALLMDLRVGGGGIFSVRKDGLVILNAAGTGSVISGNTSTFGTIQFGGQSFGSAGLASIRDAGIFTVRNTGSYNWVSSDNAGVGTIDASIHRDAADTLAQRRGVNAQAFRIYNTFTDASNYERVSFGWSTNIFTIGRESAGTGITRNIRIVGGNAVLGIGEAPSAAVSWTFSANNILAGTDNAYDIGAAAASRPRNLFLGSYMQLSEMTAPAAPAANNVVIYAEDNGAGKTRLMARFATGAAQQIAIEP